LIAAYSFAVSMVLFKIIDATIGLRVNIDEEREGLDISQHGETGYTH
jgi:ammonium transporter, Amt family